MIQIICIMCAIFVIFEFIVLYIYIKDKYTFKVNPILLSIIFFLIITLFIRP